MSPISSTLHRVKGIPTNCHEQQAVLLGHKHIVYKQLVRETTDQHGGFQNEWKTEH